jgi:hypothetical protein
LLPETGFALHCPPLLVFAPHAGIFSPHAWGVFAKRESQKRKKPGHNPSFRKFKASEPSNRLAAVFVIIALAL